MLPNATNSIGQNIEDIAGLGAAGLAAQAYATGRTKPGGPLAAVPINDPLFVPVTAGQIVILHFLWPFIWVIFFVPVLVIGAIPFIGIVFLAHVLFESAALTVLTFLLLVPFYAWWIVWKIAIKKVFWKMCTTLF